MTIYKNMWTNGSITRKSDEKPGEYWYPCYSPRRVSGCTYNPYSYKCGGSREWVYAVNRMMAQQAQANFQRQQMS